MLSIEVPPCCSKGKVEQVTHTQLIKVMGCPPSTWKSESRGTAGQLGEAPPASALSLRRPGPKVGALPEQGSWIAPLCRLGWDLGHHQVTLFCGLKGRGQPLPALSERHVICSSSFTSQGLGVFWVK